MQNYLDKEDHENELKQVLGETQSAHYVGEDIVLIIGSHGILMAGPNVCCYEEILLCFLSLMSKSQFVRTFFYRTLVLYEEDLGRLRHLIHHQDENPNSMLEVRQRITTNYKRLVLLKEILSYLSESTALFKVPSMSNGNAVETRLRDIFDLETRNKDLCRRIADLNKNLDGAQHELANLQDLSDVITANENFRAQEALQTNTKNLEDVFRSNERASSSLEILQVILAGSLAFDLLDRLTGEWSVVETPWAQR
eukprot:TRINITY_DN1046_c0_g3_i2.p1 TRINITY_DN1046_c0_g3~~TRINITY_DN1046_c0_g3_i2.p1  ORF type:complete len:253 (-),score=82.22 TRINITY_DN1046_c0_g3_i2:549-1307(-)